MAPRLQLNCIQVKHISIHLFCKKSLFSSGSADEAGVRKQTFTGGGIYFVRPAVISKSAAALWEANVTNLSVLQLTTERQQL